MPRYPPVMMPVEDRPLPHEIVAVKAVALVVVLVSVNVATGLLNACPFTATRARPWGVIWSGCAWVTAVMTGLAAELPAPETAVAR